MSVLISDGNLLLEQIAEGCSRFPLSLEVFKSTLGAFLIHPQLAAFNLGVNG